MPPLPSQMPELKPCPLKWLEDNCYDIRCVDCPTGGDDSDIGWRVISHHMDKPNERVEGYGSTPIQALEDAGYTRAASVPSDKDRADVPTGLPQTTALDAKRYRRLRVLGVAPCHTEHLKNGNVMRFTNLDDFVDGDLSNYVRGEAALTASDQSRRIEELLEANNRYLQRARDAEETICLLTEALKLADATLSGSNMNLNVVEKKIKQALALAKKAGA